MSSNTRSDSTINTTSSTTTGGVRGSAETTAINTSTISSGSSTGTNIGTDATGGTASGSGVSDEPMPLEIPGSATPSLENGAVAQCPRPVNRYPRGCKLSVEVIVKTRLGGFIVPGAKVNIFEAEPTAEGAGGTAVNAQGKYTKKYPVAEATAAPAGGSSGSILERFSTGVGTLFGSFADALPCCNRSSLPQNLIIEAIYENSSENLKKEVARLYIEDIRTTPVATKAVNIIRLIQDEATTARDRDYYEQVVLIANKSFTTGIATTATDEEIAAETTATAHPGFAYANDNTVSTIEVVRGNPCPSDANACDLTLRVTMYMATFSLVVPYTSQTKANETLCLIPGSAAPFTATTRKYVYASAGLAANRRTNVTVIPGHSLCGATSLEMLYDYHNLNVTADDIKRSLRKDADGVEGTTATWRTAHNTRITQAQENINTAQTALDTLMRRSNRTAQEVAAATARLATAQQEHNQMTTMEAFPAITDPRTRIAVFFSNVGPSDQDERRRRLSAFPRAWQEIAWRGTLTNKLLQWHGLSYAGVNNTGYTFNRQGRCAGIHTPLMAGRPIVMSITGVHILLTRGAIINRTGGAVRAICNDPQGTLSGPRSSSHWYQTGEGEKNPDDDATAQVGKHVYYRGRNGGNLITTTARSGTASHPFNFISGAAVTINQPFTEEEIQQRIVTSV